MDTKTSLLNTAEKLARSRGFDAFSYADLSKVVGISKPSIHHHFPTKADLALGLITRYRKSFFADLGKIKSGSATAKDQLHAYLALYRKALCNGEQVCLCVAFSAGRDSFDHAVLAELNRFNTDSVTWLRDLFHRGNSDGTLLNFADADASAHMILALAEGAQLVARAAQDPKLFDKAVAGMIP